MSTLHTLWEIAEEEQARLRRNEPLATGLPSGVGLERLVPGGIPRDKVTTVYADEGTFKSTLVTQIQLSVAGEGPVVYISLEDSAKLCAHRLLARMSGVDFGRIQGGILAPGEREVVMAANLSPAMQNMFIVDDIEPTIERCFAAAKAVKDCRALVIDYIQLLEGPGDGKTTLEHAMKSAQRFAVRNKIAVICVSQRKTIDMEGARRADPRPVTGDMFGSAAMRMATKLAVGLFRPWTWAKVPTQSKGPYGPYVKWMSADPSNIDLYPNILEVHVTKQVAGPPGFYNVLVYPETGVIVPYPEIRAYT